MLPRTEILHEVATEELIPTKMGGCSLSQWGPWSACSQPCGRGVSLRTRSFLSVKGLADSRGCGALLESKGCSTGKCSSKCTFSSWSAWSRCSETCGWGQSIRKRKVSGGRTECGSKQEIQPCHSRRCNDPSVRKPGESSAASGGISKQFWEQASPKSLTSKLQDSSVMPYGWEVSKVGYDCKGESIDANDFKSIVLKQAGRVQTIAECAQMALKRRSSNFVFCDDPQLNTVSCKLLEKVRWLHDTALISGIAACYG